MIRNGNGSHIYGTRIGMEQPDFEQTEETAYNSYDPIEVE